MKFFEKLGKLLVNNIAYTIILVVALIFFLYFAGGDLIAGILTAVSALVVYVAITLLYQEYKKMPAGKSTKKTATKSTKKSKK